MRQSPVHGQGVFALIDIAADEDVVEYGGEVISWAQAQSRHARAAEADGHTSFFDVGDDKVIDGGRGGNSARWINHGCEPNCEAVDDDGRIIVRSLVPIDRGAELFIDYQLSLDDPASAATRKLYRCRCAAPTCRGTMLAT